MTFYFEKTQLLRFNFKEPDGNICGCEEFTLGKIMGAKN
jgi:hypothetical protein